MAYQRQFNLKYNPDTDQDVIRALERSGSPVDYVRRLVRERENIYYKIMDDLDYLYRETWLTDIPSPTVPEYIEHHRDVQHVLKCIEGIKRKYDHATAIKS